MYYCFCLIPQAATRVTLCLGHSGLLSQRKANKQIHVQVFIDSLNVKPHLRFIPTSWNVIMTSFFLMFSFSSCLSRESSPLTKERFNGAFSEDIELPNQLVYSAKRQQIATDRTTRKYSQSSVVLIDAALILNRQIKTKCESNRERTTTYTVRSPTFSTYKKWIRIANRASTRHIKSTNSVTLSVS